LRPFDYYSPATVEEAVALLGELGEFARPIAGGTDLVVQMKEGRTKFHYPDMVVNLSGISGIKGIEFSENDGLRIGAAATMSDVAGNAIVRERYPALAEGAGVVGSLQTMNMGTIGGNVCNAAPSADTAPPLLAYEAQAVIVGRHGRRSLPLGELFAGPGATTLEQGEIVAEFRLPTPPSATGGAYQRHTPRKQMDIAVVGVAAVLTLQDGRISRPRIALGAVAPTPIRATAAEAILEGQTPSPGLFAQAAESAAAECSPIDDIRASAEYRRHLVKVMTDRILLLAGSRRAEVGPV
jgi:carbon-monoxide dehydrogenase medium subunit